MKSLKEINKKIILDQFGSLDNFYSQLKVLAKNVPADNKLLIDEIRIYYNDLFELDDMSIEFDLRQMENVVRDNLAHLKAMRLESNLLKTLIELFELNLESLKGVKTINQH